MSYKKNNWKSKDRITKEKLNNIENGIYDAHNELKIHENEFKKNNSNIENYKKKYNNGLFTDIGNKYRGASIYIPIRDIDNINKFIEIVKKCKECNCNTIVLCPIMWMETGTSNVFSGYKGGLTKEQILEYCKIIKEYDMYVCMKPHVGGENISSHGDIKPSNISTWFNNYSSLYLELINLCKEYIDIICISNELNGQTNQLKNKWVDFINLIRNIKSTFKIGTACHYGELKTNVCLEYLDFLGFNMYVPVVGDLSTNIEVQRASLLKNSNAINELFKKANELSKPIIITEVGILPFEISLSKPESWGFTTSPEIIEEVQVRYYNIALKEYLYANNVIGTFIWNACDGYTFIGRKAQQTVKELYGGEYNV